MELTDKMELLVQQVTGATRTEQQEIMELTDKILLGRRDYLEPLKNR